MKASRFTEAQKAFILKQGEQGTPVAKVGPSGHLPTFLQMLFKGVDLHPPIRTQRNGLKIGGS